MSNHDGALQAVHVGSAVAMVAVFCGVFRGVGLVSAIGVGESW